MQRSINSFSAAQPITAKTNGTGELWLLVGTDSGFEGLTTLYYNKIKVVAEVKPGN